MCKIMRLLFFFFACAVFFPSQDLLAKIIYQETTEYYEIKGGSDRELKKMMQSLGPKGSDGKRYYAHTAWQVNWNFYMGRRFGGCMIAGIQTTVNVKYLMPKWVDEKNGPEMVQKHWREFMQALQEHEKGHADIAMKAAKEIEEALPRTKLQPVCEAVAKKANESGQEIINKFVAMEKDYDSKTKHGKTQGAVFN